MKILKLNNPFLFFILLLISCQKNNNLSYQQVDSLNVKTDNSTQFLKEEQPLQLVTGENINVITNFNSFIKNNIKVVKTTNGKIVGKMGYNGKSNINSVQLSKVDMNENLKRNILKGGNSYEIYQGNNKLYIHSNHYFKSNLGETKELNVKILRLFIEKNGKYYNFVIID